MKRKVKVTLEYAGEGPFFRTPYKIVKIVGAVVASSTRNGELAVGARLTQDEAQYIDAEITVVPTK